MTETVKKSMLSVRAETASKLDWMELKKKHGALSVAEIEQLEKSTPFFTIIQQLVQNEWKIRQKIFLRTTPPKTSDSQPMIEFFLVEEATERVRRTHPLPVFGKPSYQAFFLNEEAALAYCEEGRVFIAHQLKADHIDGKSSISDSEKKRISQIIQEALGY
jgi:hypothetical protein